VRYSGIQLDTARPDDSYSSSGATTATDIQLQLDTVGYSGIQWICCKMQNSKWIAMKFRRDTKDTVRYRQDTGEIQAGHPENTRQERAEHEEWESDET